MASQQSEGHESDDLTRACAALAATLQLDEIPRLIRPFEEGLSNRSFLVGLDDDRWVVRCASGAPALGTEFSREVRVHERACIAGLAPRIIFADATSRVLCTEFIAPGSTVVHDARVTATLLRAIHQLPCDGPALLPLERLANFRAELTHSTAAIRVLNSYDASLGDAEQLLHRGEHPVLCHNDLLRANRLQSRNRLLAIDWEYACTGDPYFDIAGVASELSEKERGILLWAYLGREPERAELQRYHANSIFYLAIYHLWMARYSPQRFDEHGMEMDLTAAVRRLEAV
ncbi:MAG: choline/ethanolamine kinase family protein [Pseudomonadota bacterium]